MKDRQTQRAVKNVLHNELGITQEKVDVLIKEYIDNKLDKKVNDFLHSGYFEMRLRDLINKQIQPIIRETLKNQLAGISIIVKTKP